MEKGKFVLVSWSDGCPDAIKIGDEVYVYFKEWHPDFSPPEGARLVKTYYRSRSGFTGYELWFIPTDLPITHLKVYRGRKYGTIWDRVRSYPDDGTTFVLWDRDNIIFEAFEMPMYDWNRREYPLPEWAREIVAVEAYRDSCDELYVERTTGWLIRDWRVRLFQHPECIKAIEVFPNYWRVRYEPSVIKADIHDIIEYVHEKESKKG